MTNILINKQTQTKASFKYPLCLQCFVLQIIYLGNVLTTLLSGLSVTELISMLFISLKFR